jgi:hypothetical protein
MPDIEQEIYDSAVEQTVNTPETPTEAPEEAKAERARDERGRFASLATEQTEEAVPEQVAPEQPQVEKPNEETRVPSWRLKEESDRRREAETQLASIRDEWRQMQMQMMHQRQPQQPQEQQEAPDIFADPQGFVQNLQENFNQQLRSLRLEQSLKDAHRSYGDKFNEAYSAFTDYISKTRDQATYQRVMASSDQGESLVQWHKDQTLQKELGGSDLQTFLEKQREEWLKDPAVQAKVIEAFKATQQAGAPSNIISTPSLSRVPSAASAHDGTGSSPQDIYNYATKR